MVIAKLFFRLQTRVESGDRGSSKRDLHTNLPVECTLFGHYWSPPLRYTELHFVDSL